MLGVPNTEAIGVAANAQVQTTDGPVDFFVCPYRGPMYKQQGKQKRGLPSEGPIEPTASS